MNIYNKYLSSVAGICFDAPNDQNKPPIKTKQELIAEERAKIDAENKSEKTVEEIEADKKAAEEIEAKAKEEAEAKEKLEKEEAEKKAKGGEEGEVDETENDPEKLRKSIERLQKRIDKLTAKNKLTENEKTELAVKLKEIETTEGKTLLTEEDVETRAEKKAAEKVAQREFVDTCNSLFEAGVKADKNFKVKVDAMAEEIGPIPGQMIGVLGDLENGGNVLNYLTNDIEEAERIYALSPAKMAVELTKLSTKLTQEAEDKAKTPKKEISKAPPQSEPPGGTQKTDMVLRDNEPMDDWMKKRQAQVEERRRIRGR